MKKQNYEYAYEPLKNCRELASMLKQLPREERLRIEGIIIGCGMRNAECQQPAPAQ